MHSYMIHYKEADKTAQAEKCLFVSNKLTICHEFKINKEKREQDFILVLLNF